MTKPKKISRDARQRARLREQAEALLEKSPQVVSAKTGGDVRNLVHELRVHQAELEMQNEELRRVQLELENSRDRFAQLYDLAPVGYLTLDAEGAIREINLTAARLFGLDRRELLKKKLSRFIAPESQDDFYLLCQQAFTAGGQQTCDLQMHRPDGTVFDVRLASVPEPVPPGQPAQCLVALSDVTTLRRAEALRQSEANYRALFELNPCPMWICDENTLEFLDVNEAALRLYGWSRKEFLRMTAKDIRPLGDVPKFLDVINKQLQSRAEFVGEWRHTKRDGSVFDVAVTISSIPYAGRQARLVVVNDITDRKRAEAALKGSEEQYRRLFEDDLTGDFLATPAGRILLCNPAFVKIYRFSSRSSAQSGNVSRFNPEEWPRLVERLRRRGHIVRHQAWHKSADGRRIHIVENLVGIFNQRKELIQVKGYVFDDTARKRAETQLRKLNALLEHRVAERTKKLNDTNKRLHAIVDTALVGIITLDEQGTIESMNPAAMQLFGYAPKEIVGCDVGRLMASPDQAQHENFLDHYLQTREKQVLGVRGEVLGRCKDGSALMLELSLAEFSVEGQRRFVAMVRDITERKRLERELLDIGEHERLRIGHDLHDGLGQQLHGLFYLAALLEKDLQEDTSPRAREARQLNKYLAEALEMARSLAHGLLPVKPVPEGLMIALRDLAKRTRGLYRVDCRFECRSLVLIHRHSAANHLFRIAQEAVNNAMKHGKPTRLRLKLAATRQRILLGVRDNGAGIRPQTKPGRGMGLHVMQYRADAISGSLIVQRHPHGGTEVVCTVKRQALLPSNNDIK